MCVHFVTCPKQGLEIEAVVLHRVGFLAYFCPKQGQDFKPSSAPLYPNMGQVPPPPPGAVPTHFNLPDHSIEDMALIPLELQPTLNTSRRKAREAYLIHRGQTLEPKGMNRRNER